MDVQLLSSTDEPEKLVCTAARNDYRADGVIHASYDEIMDDASLDDIHLRDVAEKYGHSPAEYLDFSSSDMSDPERWDCVEPEDVEDWIVQEAKTRTLIDHLVDRQHWGPFEHPSATVALEGVTRVAMAQITRHRHFTFDIMSLRYVEVDGEPRDVCAVPHLDDLETSRDGVHDADQIDQQFMADSYGSSIHEYKQLLDNDVPQEEARKVLPMGTKVNIVMSGNARAWMHLLNIRGKANVQGEARRIADAVMEQMQGWMPYTFEKYDRMLPLTLTP